MTKIQAVRYHDFSYGHRVWGHENKCGHLHGHNGRVTFHCEAEALDGVGRVVDFSVIKTTLCQWVEDNWDHRFLMYCNDPLYIPLQGLDRTVVGLSFNPTAENLALFLLLQAGPLMLTETGVTLIRVVFDETRKCSAVAELG